MFLVPINTDAPIYHFPWGTVSLITASTLTLVAAAIGWVPVEWLVLTYGDGLHPLQWVTSLFIHDGLLHLAGNMFFLWGFGLVVEGKLGWRRFVPVFLGLGIVESALEQLCLQNASGGSLGASAAIMGLMAMAVVWAPKNDIVFAYGLFFPGIIRAGSFELAILTFASLLTACEIISIWWLDVYAGAAVLHLVGGLLGFALGVVLLRNRMVDCEGWDLFSVLAGKHHTSTEPLGQMATVIAAPRKRRKGPRKRAKAFPQARVSTAEARISELLEARKPRAALREWHRLQHLKPGSQLDQSSLNSLSIGLCRIGMWHEAAALMEESIARFEDEADEIRIRLAAILLKRLNRPKAALRMLEPVDFQSVAPASLERCRQLTAAAQELIDSGVIELREVSSESSSASQAAGVGVEARC